MPEEVPLWFCPVAIGATELRPRKRGRKRGKHELNRLAQENSDMHSLARKLDRYEAVIIKVGIFFLFVVTFLAFVIEKTLSVLSSLLR